MITKTTKNSEMVEIWLKNIIWKMHTEKKIRKIMDIIYSRFP